jgi:hypothetical protein
MPNIPRPYRHLLVLVLRAPGDWNPDQSTLILDPARGCRGQSPVRARLLEKKAGMLAVT